MIRIMKSPTAGVPMANVTKDELLDSASSHLFDVAVGLNFCRKKLLDAITQHDLDKETDSAGFHADFVTEFKSTKWWDNHRKMSRHHLTRDDGIPKDVNLLDVLEHVVDCVMAGMARTGDVYELKLPDALLQRAFKNTVDLLKANVVVLDDGGKES